MDFVATDDVALQANHRQAVAEHVGLGGVAGLGRRELHDLGLVARAAEVAPFDQQLFGGDRKSTRLNSSHVKISYAVFCLKKKKSFDNCKEWVLDLSVV